jgi:CHAT domain-containing protein
MGTVAFVLTHGEPEPSLQIVDVPEFTTARLNGILFGEQDPLEGTPSGWVNAVRRIAGDELGWMSVLDRVLDDLADGLLTKVLAALPERVKRLFLLPAAGLYLLPLHAVPIGDARRLCDRFTVSYAPSAGVLDLLRTRALLPPRRCFYGAACPTAAGMRSLPFAEFEVRTIAALFPDEAHDFSQEVTRANVSRQVIGRAYVHFACHGLYDWIDPVASGLELADGRLTLRDLLDGRLDLTAARLVTLSACEAGMTDILLGGAEEYVGLPAGFLISGVPCVVSTLWAVDDLAGAMITGRFYANHLSRGMDFARALGAAQDWLRSIRVGDVIRYLEEAQKSLCLSAQATIGRALSAFRQLESSDPDLRPYVHPHYWAAFTVNGL